MKVYEMYPEEEYKAFKFLNEEEEEKFDRFEECLGKPYADKWEPIRLYSAEAYNHYPMPDIKKFLGTLIFSKRAKVILEDLLLPYGEFLQLSCEGNEFFIFNVLIQLDALNEEKSEVKRFKSSGGIMRVVRYEFFPEVIDDQVIFKIPQQKTRTYVTDKLVEKVIEHGLEGLGFDERWSSQG